MSELIVKLKEVLKAVLPVTFIVLLLHFTLTPLGTTNLLRFLIGSVMIIGGLSFFLFGIDQSIEPIGHGIGKSLASSGKLTAVIAAGLVLGFFISFAEPDLHILAKQIDQVTAGIFPSSLTITAVSVGIAILMTLGLIRIVHVVPLKIVFTLIYLFIMLLCLFVPQDFIALAFDASGATTGAITVPFMLALSGGVSALKRNSKSGEIDSFGLVGIASSGAILAVLIAGKLTGPGSLQSETVNSTAPFSGWLNYYLSKFIMIAVETFLSLLPILIAYLFFHFVLWKAKRRRFIANTRGLLVTYLGLVLFLLGVNSGFMEIGSLLGQSLAALKSPLPMLAVAFTLGLVTVLAEPAVYVLTHQVEDLSGGSVRRPLVLSFLSISIGLAILLAVVRILVPGLELWMYLLPGYLLILIMSYFVPNLFVGIAFDAGGVASGPMTATFSLAFIQGIAHYLPQADIIRDGFGMIALVAMMPIVSLQILGLLYRLKSLRQKRLLAAAPVDVIARTASTDTDAISNERGGDQS